MATELNTSQFKKKFHMMTLAAKFDALRMIGMCLEKDEMPSGRRMLPEERKAIFELAEWGNLNIFFDATPKYQFNNEVKNKDLFVNL